MRVGPNSVQVGVPQDAEQPRLGPGRIAKLVQLELGLAKRLLRQVVGVGRRPGQPEGVSVQRLVVGVHKLLDAPLTAGPLHTRTYTDSHDPRRAAFIPTPSARLTEPGLPYGQSWIHARA